MDLLQFYPTPPALARRCWRKFTNPHVTRLLEPSAGRGDLAPSAEYRSRNRMDVDACEIDVSHHPTLREKRIRVIGLDFLEMTPEAGARYSHVLMNPPFKDGAKHVLHAWEIITGGEIVAILNAETVKNAFSAERQLLARLIEQHGDVEFVSGAFTAETGAERNAEVDVAIVHLTKPHPSVESVVGDLIGKVRAQAGERDVHEFALDEDGRVAEELVVQGVTKGEIEALVMIVKIASEAAADAARAKFRSRHYSRMIGLDNETMVALGLRDSLVDAIKDRHAAGEAKEDARRKQGVQFYQELGEEIAAATEAVNKAGWTALFRRQEITKRLSSATAKALEAQMEEFSKMAFTEKNVDLFISGLIESQGSIQNEMLSSVFFGLFSHHTANMSVYRAWKSNDVHRLGMRLRMRRLIIPHMSSYGSIDHDKITFLSDIDKVFKMLDGKQWSPEEPGSLQMMVGSIDSYRWGKRPPYDNGSRLAGEYFDVRYYRGTKTLHLFPRNAKLLDLFNRVVGRLHQWIPPMDDMATEDFWKMYASEDFGDEAIKRAGVRNWDLYQMFGTHRGRDASEYAPQAGKIEQALIGVCAEAGIDVSGSLQHDAPRAATSGLLGHEATMQSEAAPADLFQAA